MTGSEAYQIVSFEERYRGDVIALWHLCGLTRPWNDPDKDIDRKLTDTVGRLFLLVQSGPEEDVIVGTVMTGYDGHRGSIYYLCVHPDHQSSGCGRLLLEHSEVFLQNLGCPKINLFVRKGNEAVLSFYDRLDYGVEEVVVRGKRLIPDL
jgi:ribosomal protein S18 acetylase RimI-like enzyme